MHVQTLKPDSNKFHLRTYMKVFWYISIVFYVIHVYIYICADNTLSKTPLGVFVFLGSRIPITNQNKRLAGSKPTSKATKLDYIKPKVS